MKRAGLLFVLFGFVASPLLASQIANHIRVAYLAIDDPRTPPVIQQILRKPENREAYAAGAAGRLDLQTRMGCAC
jgi:hypothetical protein